MASKSPFSFGLWCLAALLLVCTSCNAVPGDVTNGKVTIRLEVLQGDPPSETIINILQSKYQSGQLDLGYPILSLLIDGQPVSSEDTNVGSSNPRANSALVFFSLVTSLVVAGLLSKNSSQKNGSGSLVVVAVICLLALPSFISAVTYQNCRLLDNSINYKLEWTVNAQDSSINFKASAQTTGWIALGISGTQAMSSGGVAPGNDIALGFKNPAVTGCEQGCINDYSTVKYELPVLDSSNDIEFVDFSEANGVTTMEWKRPLDTGDSTADRVIELSKDQNVLYAVHSNSKPDTTTTFAKHTTKGATTIDFSRPSQCPSNGVVVTIVLDANPHEFDAEQFVRLFAEKLEADRERFPILDVITEEAPFCPTCTVVDFKYNSYPVPSSDTTYVCKGFAFPADKKYHIVRFSPLKDNLQVLHHMVLYTSDQPFPAGYQSCNMAPGATPNYAWAPGEDDLTTPPDVGFPVGAGTGNLYGIIQMHYDNPTKLSSLLDSSGIRMYLTETLRPNEAGLMFLGVDLSAINIPAGKTGWHQSGACGPTSTNALGSRVLNVFASFPHMHTRGRSLWTEHFRNGQKLPNMGEDLNYDFNAQGFKPISSTIQAGDNMVTHCVWNTEGETSAIRGGESTDSEMCFNMILYYPVIPGAVFCLGSSTGCDVSTPGCLPA